MSPQNLINALAGIVFAFLGWWSNNIWNTVQNLQTQVTSLNIELARNYIPRTEVQANFDKILKKLDEIDYQTGGKKK